MQALAADGIFALLSPFAETAGPHRNPRRGVLLTGAIAGATLALGNLNAIAAVVSMCFLLSYALLNYATYVEATGASPSFRPRFRFFDGRMSLLGTLVCLAAMASIDFVAAAIALALLAAIYQYARRAALPAKWRDSWHAYRFRRVRDGLLELARRSQEARDWQPHVLVFTDDAERRPRLLRFAGWMSGGSGLITAVQLVSGDGTRASIQRRCAELTAALERELAHEDLDAFPLVIAASDLAIGAATILQAWGVGPVQANTVLLNWVEHRRPRDEQADRAYARTLRSALLLQRHVVVLDADAPEIEQMMKLAPEARRIDVWWRDDPSSRLSLLFAYLMTRTDFWEEARIRLLVPAAAAEQERTIARVYARLDEIRIDARLEIVPHGDSRALIDLSRDSAIVFLPLRIAGARLVDPFGTAVDQLLPELPVVAMVGAAEDVALVEAEREAETPADAAAAPEEPA